MHSTMIPTAEGYEFLTWVRNDGFFSDFVTQQHVPVGHRVHLESSVHLQSVQEQFNILHTCFLFIKYLDGFRDDHACINCYDIMIHATGFYILLLSFSHMSGLNVILREFFSEGVLS